MLTENVGDIFTTDQPMIVHGVNLLGQMTGGIAKIIADRYPEVEAEYIEACKDGTLTAGGFFVVAAADGVLIGNAASQIIPGRNADYALLVLSLQEAFAYCERNNISGFAVPRIGAGIGGLDWPIVHNILHTLAALHTVDVELWSLPDAD